MKIAVWALGCPALGPVCLAQRLGFRGSREKSAHLAAESDFLAGAGAGRREASGRPARLKARRGQKVGSPREGPLPRTDQCGAPQSGRRCPLRVSTWCIQSCGWQCIAVVGLGPGETLSHRRSTPRTAWGPPPTALLPAQLCACSPRTPQQPPLVAQR